MSPRRSVDEVDLYGLAVEAAKARQERMNSFSVRVGGPTFPWVSPVGPVRVEASVLPAEARRGLHPSTLVVVYPDGRVEVDDRPEMHPQGSPETKGRNDV